MTKCIDIWEAKHISKCWLNVIHTHYLLDLCRLISAVFRPYYERHFSVKIVVEIVNRNIALIIFCKNRISKWIIVEISVILLSLYLCVMVTINNNYSVIKKSCIVKVCHELTDSLICIVNRLKIRSKLCTLKERCRFFLIHPILFVVHLILEIYLIVAHTLNVSKRRMVCEHKERTIPLIMLLVYLLDLWNCLSEERFVWQTKTNSFINVKIFVIVKEIIITKGMM